MAYNPTVGKSQVAFSTGGTIASGAEFDSGWLDMSETDKIQLSLFTQDNSYTGVNTQILSRQAEGQPELISNTAPAGGFFLYNIICRQQQMRWRVINNNSYEMTGATFELKRSFGGSDKLSVFPLATTPSNFSQAALTQSVGIGADPNGSFTNAKQGNYHDAFTTNTPLAGGGTYDSGIQDILGFTQLWTEISSDVAGTLVGTWYDDAEGTNVVRTFTAPYNPDDGLFFSTTVVLGQYLRYVYSSTTAQARFHMRLKLDSVAYSGQFLKLDAFVPPNILAAVTRSINLGRQPDGDYVNTPADGELLRTDVTLAGDGVYLSDWYDTDGWSTLELFVATDVASANNGIKIEYTDDANVGSPTVRATVIYEFKAADLVRGFATFNVPTKLDGLRVRYTNGSDAQGVFVLVGTLKVAPQNNNYNRAGALLVGDFATEVALGTIDNYTINTKFGRNPDIDIGIPEDMWNGGSTYTGHPVNFTPETMEVFSSSANDTAGGSGAQSIRFFGLRTSASTVYESEDIIMNGTTPVTSTGTWWRVNSGFVTSGDTNQGTITVRPSTTTSAVMVQMPTFGRTTIGAWTAPAGQVCIIKRIRVAITRANGSAGSATITLRVREPGGVYQAVRVFELQTGAAVSFTLLGGIVVPAGSDVKFRIDSVSDNNTVAEGAFEYILINGTA